MLRVMDTLVSKAIQVSAEGRQAIASIFKALARVVSRITLTEIRVSESSSSGPRPYVVIDAVATYHFLGGLLKLPIRTLSRLEFDERGSKVLAHEDVWSLADLFSRLWVIGFLYNLFRSGLGALIGLLLG